MVVDIFRELGHLALLLGKLGVVLLGLFGHHAVVGLHLLHRVDVLPVLEDVHLCGLALFIGQVAGSHFVVVWRETVKYCGIAQPPVRVSHTHGRVAGDSRFNHFTDVARQCDFVKRLQRGVDVAYQHLPAGHTRVLLVVWVQAVVPFAVVAAVVGYQFFIGEVLFIFVQFVALVAHLLAFGAPLAFAVEASDAFVVLVDDAAFLRAVHRFCVLLLRVLRSTEANEGEGYAGLQKACFILRHQVVFHLNAGRHSPAVVVD